MRVVQYAHVNAARHEVDGVVETAHRDDGALQRGDEGRGSTASRPF
jgi:hypothetical protein